MYRKKLIRLAVAAGIAVSALTFGAVDTNTSFVSYASSEVGDRTQNSFKIVDRVLIAYTGSGGDVEIPSGVTKIEKSIFKSNSTIISVAIPKKVESIGTSTFRGCTNLTIVKIKVTTLFS